MSDSNLAKSAAIARRLAEQHPEATLPCPGCAAEVKGRNLDKHLTKVHGAAPTSAPSGDLALSGADRRIGHVFMAGLVAWMLGIVLGLPFTPRDQHQLFAGIGVVGLVALGALGVAAYTGRFGAMVHVTNTGLELKWFLGLASKSVRFPVRISSGGLRERRQSSVTVRSVDEGWGPSADYAVGGYIELAGDGGKLRLGAKNGPRLRKFWKHGDLENGPPRRTWDVQLQAAELAQLQYVLAEQGLLEVRPPE